MAWRKEQEEEEDNGGGWSSESVTALAVCGEVHGSARVVGGAGPRMQHRRLLAAVYMAGSLHPKNQMTRRFKGEREEVGQ